MAKFVASVVAVVQAGDIAVTWSDCGDASTHGHISDLQPPTISTGTTASVVGTGTLDEQITGGTFSAVVKAGGIKVVSCSGDASKDIECKLPLGVGAISVKALSFPLAPGELTVTATVQTSSAIPASLAVTQTHISATSDTGDDLVCVDLSTKAGLEAIDCSTATCPSVCTCATSKCSSQVDACLADSTCSALQTCVFGCACGDVACAATCIGSNTLGGAVLSCLSSSCSSDEVSGGVMDISWEDCGDSSTHGHITDLQPTQITIGQDGTLTGTGTIDEELTDGTFSIQITADLGIKETYTGKACEAKTFNLPLGLGTVSWGGLDCPVAAGTITQKVGFTMSSLVPASLAKADVVASALDMNGEKAVCVTAHLQRASTGVSV